MYLRKGNLKLNVTQDNIKNSIIINELQKSVDKRDEGDFFGYSNIDLKGRELKSILPEDINEILDDNIEYNPSGNDLKSVLEKIIRFKVKNKKGDDFDMNAYVERAMAEGDNLSFDITLEKKIHLKEKIKSILSGIHEVQMVEHPKAKLMNAEAYSQVLDEVFDFLYETKISAVMLIMSIDGYPMLRRNLGHKKIEEILQKISYTLKTTLRNRDISAYLGVGHFAVTMVKTYPDEVIFPLKRLEQNLRREGVLNSKISMNARYKLIDLGLSVQDAINQVKTKDIDYRLDVMDEEEIDQ